MLILSVRLVPPAVKVCAGDGLPETLAKPFSEDGATVMVGVVPPVIGITVPPTERLLVGLAGLPNAKVPPAALAPHPNRRIVMVVPAATFCNAPMLLTLSCAW